MGSEPPRQQSFEGAVLATPPHSLGTGPALMVDDHQSLGRSPNFNIPDAVTMNQEDRELPFYKMARLIVASRPPYHELNFRRIPCTTQPRLFLVPTNIKIAALNDA